MTAGRRRNTFRRLPRPCWATAGARRAASSSSLAGNMTGRRELFGELSNMSQVLFCASDGLVINASPLTVRPGVVGRLRGGK